MIRVCCLFLFACSVFAQQQVTPDDFTGQQADTFKTITESVSAPCCQNGIPVAYHASSMAQQIRDIVAQRIRDGKKRRQIMAELGDMRFGENNELKVIFTVPDENWLGTTFWFIGLILLVLLVGVMWFMLKQKPKTSGKQVSDDALLDKYREFILHQVKEMG